MFLKKTVPQPIKDKKKMKELVVRMIYVEMLGQDASFAYIKAVELCASTSIAQKKAGYLAGKLEFCNIFDFYVHPLSCTSFTDSFAVLVANTRIPFYARQPNSAGYE